jgi:predicted DNA-binding protein
MNRTIKQFAIDCQVASAEQLNDPETDGYRTYDGLTQFVEQTKQYYMNRAVQQCLDICDSSGLAVDAAQRIREQFGIKQ